MPLGTKDKVNQSGTAPDVWGHLEPMKVVIISPCNGAYFDLALHSKFKTKRSLRSDVDRSTDSDKMTLAHACRGL